MEKNLNIGHLYPELLNLYGDLGNIAVLSKRSEWRGIKVNVHSYGLKDAIPFDELDIILLGGGSDREQTIVCNHLQTLKEDIKAYVDQGKVLLAVCGGYQLLGDYYETSKGKIQGLGLFDLYTKQEAKRIVGNVVLETEITGESLTLLGFENHGGRTYHKYRPFGKVIKGVGNNETDGVEGIWEKHVLGTYLHGPLLTKNPEIADTLIKWALEHKYGEMELEPLNDTLEKMGREVLMKRI